MVDRHGSTGGAGGIDRGHGGAASPDRRGRRRRPAPRRTAVLVIAAALGAVAATGCGSAATTESSGPTTVAGTAGTTSTSELAAEVTPEELLAEAQQRWDGRGPSSYRWVLDTLCMCEQQGALTIVVRDGAVVSAEPTTSAGGAGDQPEALTVDELLERVEAAQAGGGSVSARYDLELGYPTDVSLGQLEPTMYRTVELTPL